MFTLKAKLLLKLFRIIDFTLHISHIMYKHTQKRRTINRREGQIEVLLYFKRQVLKIVLSNYITELEQNYVNYELDESIKAHLTCQSAKWLSLTQRARRH